MAASKSMQELHQEAQELERTLARQREQKAGSADPAGAAADETPNPAGAAADETPTQSPEDSGAAAVEESVPTSPEADAGTTA